MKKVNEVKNKGGFGEKKALVLVVNNKKLRSTFSH